MSTKPILISGSHRSGTTWVGKIIAKSPQIGYIHEPFNPERKAGTFGRKFESYFLYLNDELGEKYVNDFRKLFRFKYRFKTGFSTIERSRDIYRVLHNLSRFNYYRMMHYKPLMKDPIAFFSAEWLSETFNMDVVITIRHPAAFVSSLKRLNWQFDFNQFLGQKELMNDYLEPYKSEIIEYSIHHHDVIDQGILLWKIFHSIILSWKIKHRNWTFITNENLSYSPIHNFKRIFENLNIKYTNKVHQEILISTDSSNPVSAKPNQAFQLKLNSKANIFNWQKRLTQEEIERIKNQTSELFFEFYEEWELSNLTNYD